MEYINGIVNKSLAHHVNDFKYNKAIRFFDSEAEMLNTFLECINNHFHLIIGWNFMLYDWLYISNRCTNLGINIKKSSPTGKLINKKFGKKGKEFDVKLPAHRVLSCYMLLFQESLIYNNLGSYSLDSISEKILGLNKVSYNGNLRKLYQTDFRKFVAYTFMDTILTMLIHKATNLLTVDFFQSFYTGVPYLKLSQNSISEALIYQELRSENMFLLETERTNNEYRKYKGGYVKPPTKKIVESLIGIDYGALYPNSIITTGLSPEKKIDSITVNEDMYPATKQDEEKWLKYKAMGYCLTPYGRIYDIKNILSPNFKDKKIRYSIKFLNISSDIFKRLNDKKNSFFFKRKQHTKTIVLFENPTYQMTSYVSAKQFHDENNEINGQHNFYIRNDFIQDTSYLDENTIKKSNKNKYLDFDKNIFLFSEKEALNRIFSEKFMFNEHFKNFNLIDEMKEESFVQYIFGLCSKSNCHQLFLQGILSLYNRIQSNHRKNYSGCREYIRLAFDSLYILLFLFPYKNN
jgi:hypothetical protein